jgi:hypothetical protein
MKLKLSEFASVAGFAAIAAGTVLLLMLWLAQ